MNAIVVYMDLPDLDADCASRESTSHFKLTATQFHTVLCDTMADPVDSMLDLMRRLPPSRVEENVNALIRICPDYADDLLGSVDQPLKVMTDRATGRDYLACDYNRDGDSYR
jgi:hypothetical protein